VAATLNWRNSVWGYWISFATVGIADTSFIFLAHVPGNTPRLAEHCGPDILGTSDDFLDNRSTDANKGATRSFTAYNTELKHPQ